MRISDWSSDVCSSDLLTHGHNDHVGDALAILKKTDAMLVANYEICNYLAGQGANGDKVNPGLHGGTVDCGGFTTTFVNALHSSSFGMEGGQNVYLRSEEHTSELQSLMRISYAVFCLKQKKVI